MFRQAKLRHHDETGTTGHVVDKPSMCGKIVALEQDHRWFENSDVGHDEGRAPLASFAIHYPEEHADRVIEILFKYSSAISLPEGADIGRSFVLELPADVLDGDYKTIDNMTIERLQKIDANQEAN